MCRARSVDEPALFIKGLSVTKKAIYSSIQPHGVQAVDQCVARLVLRPLAM